MRFLQCLLLSVVVVVVVIVGSWQGDSLALTEDEVTVLMEEIEEEQEIKLLDIR